ncbi:HNH endonuclease [Micromonospora echinospora]
MTRTPPPAAAPENIGYIPGNATNNAVLLMVMRPLWNYRCYWCNEPAEFRQMAVDHIIPRTVSAERLTELKTHFGLPADFGVHRPGNLAPICTPCNTKKSSSDYGDRPVLLDHLNHAAKDAHKVVKQVQRFAALNELGPALLKLLSADLDDPEICTALRSWMPDLLHTAVSLDPDAIGDVVARRAELDLGLDLGSVTLAFAWRAAAAADLLEEITGRSPEAALELAVDRLVALMCRTVQDGLDGLYGPHGHVSAGPAEAADVTVTLTTVTIARTGTSLNLTFTGTVYSQFETTLTQSMFEGDGLEDLQAETEANGRFSLAVSCELADPPGPPEMTDVRITRWKPSTLLWNSDELSFVDYDDE